MKRPILYRVVLYSAMMVSWGFVFFLLGFMKEAPFTSKGMRDAYFAGCNIGLRTSLTNESITRCASIADTFKETLDDLDRQMSEITK